MSIPNIIRHMLHEFNPTHFASIEYKSVQSWVKLIQQLNNENF